MELGRDRPARCTSSRWGPRTSRDLGTMSQRALPRARAPLPRRAAARRHARAARQARAIAPRSRCGCARPSGRTIARTFRLGRLQRSSGGGCGCRCRVPAPELWSPDAAAPLLRRHHAARPRARCSRWSGGASGLRSVQGQARAPVPEQPPRPAARRLDPRGHAGLTAPRSPARTWTRIVRELKDLGANVTRAHYLHERAAARALRPRRASWSGTRRRSGSATTARTCSGGRRSASARSSTVARTVKAGRSHPSVLTHSVANELSFTPGREARHAASSSTARAVLAGDLDPTIPISVDIKGRPGYGEQFTYERFELLGREPVLRLVPLGGGLRRLSSRSSTSCATTTRAPRS